MFIHASAFILLVFYAISKIRISMASQFILVFLCFISFHIKKLFWSMLQYIPLDSGRVLSFIYAAFFLDSKAIIRIVLLISFGLIFINKSFLHDEKKNKKFIFCMCQALECIFHSACRDFSANLSVYGFLMLVLLVPNSLKSLKIKSNRTFYFK